MEMQDSIRTTTVWESENEIFEPVTVHEPVQEAPKQEAPKAVRPAERPAIHARYGVPQYLAFPYVAPQEKAEAETPAADTATGEEAADTTAIVAEGEMMEGIVLVDPASKYKEEAAAASRSQVMWKWADGMSWVYLGLILLFIVISMKFKGSSRYMKALFSDLTDTRLRSNVFDDTVKETSLLVLLDLLWCGCAGILLWELVKLTLPWGLREMSGIFGAGAALPVSESAGVGICIGISALYVVFMTMAYLIVGNVFSDSGRTRLWLKGAAASTGLESFVLFPVALLTLIYPAWSGALLVIGGSIFVIGKLVFMYKGFRIFFAEISSWMLFLYYLCSLEIVPLLLAYYGAIAVCMSWQ